MLSPHVLKLQSQLIRGLKGQALRNHQAQQLRKVFEQAKQNSPHYRALLKSHTSNDKWSLIPITTRGDLQANIEQIYCNVLPDGAGAVLDGWTSGSSGTPTRFRKTRLTDDMNKVPLLRFHSAWNVDPGQIFLTVRLPRRAEERAATGMLVKTRLPGQLGTEYSLYNLDVELAARHIRDLKPNYIRSYPNLVRAIAQKFRQKPPENKIELVITIGEVMTDDTREEVRSLLGAEIADCYGAEEVGTIATQCPKCGEYHCCNENVYVEIIAENGEIAQPGETGRVVLTPFFNPVMPLLRYEIGDYAVAGGLSEKCGAAGTRIAKIFGRHKNMFFGEDGKRVWPYLPAKDIGLLGILQFKLTQLSYEGALFEFVAMPGKDPDISGVPELVRTYIDLPLSVEVRRVEFLSRTAAGKFTAFESLVG